MGVDDDKDGQDELAKALTAAALEDQGRLSLTTLLVRCVPLVTLRDRARGLGLSPKGYRIERAPAAVLAKAMADPKIPAALEAATGLVADVLRAGMDATAARHGTGSAAKEADEDLGQRLSAAERELDSTRRERDEGAARLERLQSQVRRSRGRADELGAQIVEHKETAARQRAEIDNLRRRLEETSSDAAAADAPDVAELRQRIVDLERDLAAVLETDEGHRKLLAAQISRIRELEALASELEELVPKSELRRRRMERAAEPEPVQLRVPYLTPEFYRSLEGKERRSIERAIQAILMFCTEGPAYPGLEVKRLEGQQLWSMRASLKLRVYFRFRDDGDIEVLLLADRGDQHTVLRRMKERGS